MTSIKKLRQPRRVHFWMEEEDFLFYKQHFSIQPGFSASIQTILHAFRVRLEAKQAAQEAHRPLQTLEEDFEMEEGP